MDIYIPPPENLQTAHTGLFPSSSYSTGATPAVRRVRNAFHCSDGICLKNGLPLKESFYAGTGNALRMGLRAIRTYRAAKIKKRLPVQTLRADTEYIAIMHPWINYYHWIFDCLPRLLWAPKHPYPTIILGEGVAATDFVRSSLAYFPEFSYEVIPDGVHCIVPDLLISQIRRDSRFYDPAVLNVLRSRFTSRNKQGLHSEPRAVFISRQNAARRRIRNFDEIAPILSSHGVAILDLELLPLAEQIRSVAESSVLIGLHGAGLSNLLFAADQPVLFEILGEPSPKAYGGQINCIYRHLTAVLGGNYFYQLAPVIGEQDPVLSADVRVDPLEFEKTLLLALSHKQQQTNVRPG